MDAIVIDLSRFIRNYIVSAIQETGQTVQEFSSATAAMEAIRGGLHPRLIVTSLVTADLGGLEFLRLVRANPSTSSSTLVLVTSSSSAAVESEALAEGFAAVFHKNELQRFIGWLAHWQASALEQEAIRGRILHVEDSPTAVAVIARILEGKPVEIQSCGNVDSAIALLGANVFDLVISDYNLEGGKTGLDLVKAIRQDLGQRVPVLVLSSIESRERKIEILESGANDFVSKPVVPRELLVRVGLLLENKHLIDRLESQKRLLFSLAMRDQLTSLLNRRSLFEIAPKEVASAHRHGYAISLLMLDLDHFKNVNDNYGHQAGDTVLREIGALLQSSLREGDYAARFGGEEFVVMMTHCSLADATSRAEELRQAVEDLNPNTIPVTTSIGVSTLVDGWSFEALFKAADEAVYKAKEGGRNRVEFSE